MKQHVLTKELVEIIVVAQHAFQKLTTLNVAAPLQTQAFLLSQACSLPDQQGCCFSSQAVALNNSKPTVILPSVSK